MAPGPLATATMTPTQNWMATPHSSPTYMATPPMGIVWDPALIMNVNGAVFSSLYLSVNGVLEATAGVTLTTPSGNVPYTFIAGGSGRGSYAYYGNSVTFVYQAGQPYTLTTVTSIGTATATVIAPGGNFTLAPDDSWISWLVEGNEDFVRVMNLAMLGFTYDSETITADIDSVFSIPPSAYPSPGNYQLTFHAQTSNYSVTGAAPGSRLEIEEWDILNFTK